ncbi:hypothetical protein Hamer_G017856 [Homarus americanus]|uniref:Uncharacterized protein n=1 Tax=Homarus americanus TaxID=6706 RepID=A0A8J5TIR3_HOMAM|nr:hypothetical protein Hamer_G017856 [Homarus americanus]
MDTVEAARSIPASGVSDIQFEDLQEIIGQHQQQPTIEEMLEKDEEQQPTREDDVKPELLTSIVRLSEQLQEYKTRPHPRNLICPALVKGMEDYKALYMSLVNAHQQALITQYLHKAQPVNALANIALGDDDGTTNDDNEVLGDLLVEELPQDFEGFDAEVRGEEAVTSPPCLGPINQPRPSFH